MYKIQVQRFTFVIAPMLLLLLTVPLWAQDIPAEPPPGEEPPPAEQPAPEEPPGEQPAVPAEPADDPAVVDQARSAPRPIRMIEIIQALQLNGGQVEARADRMAQIKADKAEIAKLEGAVRSRDLRKIENVVTNWTELKQVSPEDFVGAQRVGAKQQPDIARLRGHVAALVGQAIERVLDAEPAVMGPVEPAAPERRAIGDVGDGQGCLAGPPAVIHHSRAAGKPVGPHRQGPRK